MVTPEAVVSRGPAALLVSVHWERIQVIVRLRPAEAGSIDPATSRLQRLDDPSVVFAATRAWTDGEDVVIRCNVMQGPGGIPLGTGSWVLAAGGGALDFADAAGEAGEAGDRLAEARFATATGTYVVRPSIVGAHLHLDVRLDRAKGVAARLRSIRDLLLQLPRNVLFQTFALAYWIARPVVARNPARLLFIGHYGSDLNGDMQAVLAGLAARGVDRGAIATVPPLRRRGIRDWLRLPIELARAATIVIEEDVLFMLPSIPARIVQLWHASGALKAIGYSRVGKPSARSPWSRHYKYFTWAIVSGEHDVPLFAEAFGMPEDRVLPLGHPRMDRFLDPAWRERAREATLAAIPQARGRKMILFAPTWRQQGTARVYDLGVLDYRRLHELCVDLDAVFVIRMHPTVVHPVDIPREFADRIVNGTTTVMDAPEQLCATDLLITDYSSIILEYSLLGRPMLFFAPDLDEYRADRDVYMPYEDFVPGRIARTFDELVAAIRAQDFQVEKVAPFARSQFTYVDGRATDRVIDLLLGH